MYSALNLNVEAVRILCEKESGKVDSEGNSALIYVLNAEITNE